MTRFLSTVIGTVILFVMSLAQVSYADEQPI